MDQHRRMPKPQRSLSRSEVVLIIAALFATLVAREWIRAILVQRGIDPSLAKHNSFIIAVPISLLLLIPVFLRQRALLLSMFRWQPDCWRLIGCGILIGILCRALWWAFATVRATSGLIEMDGQYPDLLWSFGCPSLLLLVVGMLTMAVLTPFYEEIFYRGFLQTYFERHGIVIAILISGMIFTVSHTPATSPVVFLLSIVMAFQYYATGTLWTSIATHATYNGLIQLDWVCTQIFWSPNADQLPLMKTLLPASILTVSLLFAIVWLLYGLKSRR